MSYVVFNNRNHFTSRRTGTIFKHWEPEPFSTVPKRNHFQCERTGTIFNDVEPEPFYKQANWNHFQTLEPEPFSVPVQLEWFQYGVFNNGSSTESTTMVSVQSLQQ
jgi:hypothetical protein